MRWMRPTILKEALALLSWCATRAWMYMKNTTCLLGLLLRARCIVPWNALRPLKRISTSLLLLFQTRNQNYVQQMHTRSVSKRSSYTPLLRSPFTDQNTPPPLSERICPCSCFSQSRFSLSLIRYQKHVHIF